MATVLRQSANAAGTTVTRIVVADDHPVVRFGIKNVLLADPGFLIVGEAADGYDAITQTLDLLPDVLLLDLHMPRVPGIETLRAVLDRAPGVRVLLLSGSMSLQQIIEALHLGARGVLLKTEVSLDIASSIRAVLEGHFWIGGHSVPTLRLALQELSKQAAAAPPRTTFGLTPRELEIVSGIVEGCSNKYIALKFTISEETVKRHLSNIFDKTGVSTRLELALFAINHKVIDLQP